MKVDEVMRGLLEEELYDDMRLLYEMNPCSSKGMSKQTKTNIHRMAGEAYYNCNRHELAIAAYSEALRVSPSVEEEADMRYRVAKCHYEMGQYDKSLSTLNQIKANLQKARMKKLEIELWNKLGVEHAKSKDPILDAHMAVIACCAQSISSLKYLARRRERKKKDSVILPPVSDLPFLTHWWDAHSAWGQDDLLGAVTSLVDNARLAPRIAYQEVGEMLFYIGMKEDAVDFLKKAYRLDPNNRDGLNLLVNALGQLAVDEVERMNDLEEIVMELTQVNDESPEALLAYGQLCRVKEVRKKEESNNLRAIRPDCILHLCHKAMGIRMGMRNKTDATLLKMQVLNDIERYRELLELGTNVLSREANIDVIEQMVSVNMVLKRHEGAKVLALSAMRDLPGPRSALLYAHVLSFKSEIGSPKGTEELRKVVDKYPYFIDAAVILADALIQREIFDEAILVLKTVIEKVPFVHRVVSGQLAKTLSECQLRQSEYISAYNNMHRSVVLGAETSDSPMAELNERMAEEVTHTSRGEPMEQDMAMTPSPSVSVPNPTAPFGNRRRRRNEP